MSLVTRIAICQLTCHPAFYTAHQSWLEEPFIPEDPAFSLSSLSIQGFRVDDLLTKCKGKYLTWQKERLKAIINYIENLTPVPNLILFSEGSIPYQCLDLFKSFSERTGIAVFAGTHTLQNLKESKKIYLNIGIKEKTLDRLFSKHTQINGVAPIFIGKNVYLGSKQILSPFEKSDITSIQLQNKPVYPYNLPVNEKELNILLLICAEALNFSQVKIKGDYQIVSIPSFEKNPCRFENILEMLTSNSKVILYCNDGEYGGSCIKLPIDKRRPIWWFNSVLEGKLPVGDSLLIADLDFQNLTVQVGTTDPATNFELIKLSSIVYQEDNESCNVTLSMDQIKKINEDSIKAFKIKEILDSGKCNLLQKEKYNYLYKIVLTGQNLEKWWDVIGHDLMINLPSLKQIENEMSSMCYSELSDDLIDYDVSKNGYNNLIGFLKNAKKICGKSIYSKQIKEPYNDRFESIINRDEDAKSIVSFFDNSRQKIAQITGIQQIGKTTVIEKAIKQCRFKRITEIPIQETSTAEYILFKLYSDSVYKIKPENLIIDEINKAEYESIMERFDIVWIHNSDRLAIRNKWRNTKIETVINNLIEGSIKTKCKIIFESRIELPIEIDDPNILFKKRIYGMEGKSLQHGVSFLDYQVRRVGLSPNEINIETKNIMVEKLGGHPVALALCADAILDDGLPAVEGFLKDKKGFYLNYVNKILQSIDLNEDEKTILKLLSGCRLSITREAILESFDYVISPYLKNLIELCLVEVENNTLIRLPGILKSYFDIEEVNEKLREKFHLSCGTIYKKLFEYDSTKIEFAIESDVHNTLCGKPSYISKSFFDSQFEIARNYYDKQKFKDAKDILDKIPVKNMPHDVLRLSALIDAKCNQFDASIEKAKTVFIKNRKDTWLLSQIAQTALSQGRDDIAEKLIITAKTANMEDTSILIVSGRMLLRRNDLLNAEAKFKQAVKLSIRNPWPYFYLGRIYMRTGEMDDAIDILYAGEKFIYDNDINNENALAAIKTQLGIAYLLDNQIDLAEKIIVGLYNERRNDPEVIRAFALITIKKDGIDKAFEAFQQLSEGKIRSKFDKAQFHLYLGIFYLGNGDKGNASIEFSEAHQSDKNNVYIMMKLAKTYYAMAMESYIDGDQKMSDAYAKDCALITKKILEFDSDNQTGSDLQIDLYAKFGIELSKI